MSPIDLAPPAILAPAPKLWTPAKPFIIRASEDDHAAVKAMPFLAAIAGGARLGGSVLPTLTYLTAIQHTTNVNTVDYGDVNAPTDGLMIIGIVWRRINTNLVTNSVSIGGTNGTLHYVTGSGRNHAVIASRVVSAGNQNITMSLSGNQDRSLMSAWLLTKYKSATPFGGQVVADNSNWADRTVTFDIPAYGVAVYVAMGGTTDAGTTWSSATERYNALIESASDVAAADRSSIPGITAHAETATFSGTATIAAMGGASWE